MMVTGMVILTCLVVSMIPMMVNVMRAPIRDMKEE